MPETSMDSTSQHQDLSMGTQSIPLDFAIHTMEHLGYLCVGDQEPSAEDAAKVDRVFEGSPKLSAPWFDFCKGGDESKSFLMSDHEWFRKIIKNRLNVHDFRDLKKQGPAIIEFKENTEVEQFMRAHPSREAVSVFRPLRDSAGWDNGLFKLFTSSHHQNDHEFEHSPDKDADEVVVDKKQCLFVDGALYVKLSPKGGVRMVWQGFSKRPMFGDIDNPKGLPFMKI
ncbi:hypothetical protein BO82DRAFT_396127 [Aspergillus uvarum CBS 121591]|uniref:Clavaminate synthase-like protein n=1 Tax=Aspergillus uvarum CBS 121591 TaxID=1448315 RepID=A0A319BUL7_9EURO|nr:hypothetical protein BO82DRAFT_396127 [Aspergillus uvarum CBS 121591]PYH76405.1 hypothetical protein BO82DRAFT_396127 [Aspergillus uvarum CBS 121591]